MSLGTVLLMKVFPALLPPINDEDRDFYEVLGVTRKATVEEIRKAYKTKSLSLHPDKLAQRGETNLEEAAKEYELVQEAHTVLTDKENRQLYHAVKFSPSRYRFMSGEGGMGNQMAVLENLSRSSFADKTKLVLFFSIFPALLLLQPLLLAIKVNHVLAQDGGLQDTEWTVIMIPWWIFHGLVVAFCVLVSIMAKAEARLYEAAVEQILWFLAEIFLTLHWDGKYIPDAPYAVVFIPVYLALIVRWFRYGSTLGRYNDDMRRMVSEHHFRTVILEGRELDELDEEEMKEFNKKYIVVTHIPPGVEADLVTPGSETADLTDEEKEEVRVAASREFEAAIELYHQARISMVQSIVIWTIFIILLVMKVDGHINASWWIVFLPIWVFFGAKMLFNCFHCCCAPAPMDEHEMLILAAAAKAHHVKEEEEKANKKEKGDEETADKVDNDEKKVGEAATTETITAANGTAGDEKAEGGAEPQQTSDNPTASASPVVPSKDYTTAKAESNVDQADKANGKTNNNKTEDAKQDDTEDKTGDNAGDEAKDGEGDDAIPTIELDEETYRAFKTAHVEATNRAMEKRMRSCQTTFFVCFQIIMICLVVAKLNTAYEATEAREELGPDADVDVGFNTIWLLTPLFAIVGFMICCCAFLVYNAPNPEELMHARQEDGGVNNGSNGENQDGGGDSGGGEPVILTPPPPPPVTAANDEEQGGNPVNTDDGEKPSPKTEEADPSPPIPPKVEIDMDDLD